MFVVVSFKKDSSAADLHLLLFVVNAGLPGLGGSHSGFVTDTEGAFDSMLYTAFTEERID